MAPNLVVANALIWERNRKLIRLVNSTPSKAIFYLSLDRAETSTEATIEPKKGVLDAFGYAFIRVDLRSCNKEPLRLNITYKRLGLSQDEPPRVRRTIQLCVSEPDKQFSCNKRDHFFLFIRVLRAIILLALITYNVILFKYELHG